jgi:hypothetical protein
MPIFNLSTQHIILSRNVRFMQCMYADHFDHTSVPTNNLYSVLFPDDDDAEDFPLNTSEEETHQRDNGIIPTVQQVIDAYNIPDDFDNDEDLPDLVENDTSITDNSFVNKIITRIPETPVNTNNNNLLLINFASSLMFVKIAPVRSQNIPRWLESKHS